MLMIQLFADGDDSDSSQQPTYGQLIGDTVDPFKLKFDLSDRHLELPAINGILGPAFKAFFKLL